MQVSILARPRAVVPLGYFRGFGIWLAVQLHLSRCALAVRPMGQGLRHVGAARDESSARESRGASKHSKRERPLLHRSLSLFPLSLSRRCHPSLPLSWVRLGICFVGRLVGRGCVEVRNMGCSKAHLKMCEGWDLEDSPCFVLWLAFGAHFGGNEPI